MSINISRLQKHDNGKEDPVNCLLDFIELPCSHTGLNMAKCVECMLKEYGIQTVPWYHLLRPVITRLVAAFDLDVAADGTDNVDFWQKVAHYYKMGSGMDYYSGWMNTFNVFTEKIVWMGNELDLVCTYMQPQFFTEQGH